MRRTILLAALIAGLASPAAAQFPFTPPPAPPSEAQKAWEAGQDAYRAWYGAQRGVKTTKSGLMYKRLSRAKKDEPHPPKGSVVTIHYSGQLITGDVFDQTERGEGDPATFPLDRLIPGWQEGVPLMRVGEVFEFVIPADLAYGPRAVGGIPANSTLVFQIRLLDAPEGIDKL